MHETLILMADSRSPLIDDYLQAPYYSIAAAINLAYAKRQGYGFRYCLLGEGAVLDEQARESQPQRANRRALQVRAGSRARLIYAADVYTMSFVRLLSRLPDERNRKAIAIGRRYSRLRSFMLSMSEPDPWDSVEKRGAQCHHTQWGARAAPWGKLLAIGDALAQGYERVVYIDTDAIFLQPAVSVDSFLSSSSSTLAPIGDAALTVLCNFPWTKSEANSGFMVWNNTSASRRVLQQWWDVDAGIYHFKNDFDQHVLNHHLLGDTENGRRRDIAIVPAVSLLERDGQFIRHVTSPHGWERLLRFRLGLRQWSLSGADFARLVGEIAHSHLAALNTSEGRRLFE